MLQLAPGLESLEEARSSFRLNKNIVLGLLLTPSKWFDLVNLLPAVYISNNRFTCPTYLWWCLNRHLFPHVNR